MTKELVIVFRSVDYQNLVYVQNKYDVRNQYCICFYESLSILILKIIINRDEIVLVFEYHHHQLSQLHS
jgi:hypothetical protein